MTTTNEIAENIANAHGLTKVQGKAVVEAVFAAITAAAVSGSETSIPGFGKFKIKDTPEREARNPTTGQTIKVAGSQEAELRARKGAQGCTQQVVYGRRLRRHRSLLPQNFAVRTI